jgi:nitrite reductase/ring-hydroxylating ferredoxin subunit/uncharacterized membrane protein
MIKETLQGKPLQHPLHPMLVHFPISLFALSFLLDLASLVFGDNPALVQAAFYSMALGVFMALLAAAPGFVDYSDIRNDSHAKRIGAYHMVLNLAVVALYAVNLGFRYGDLDAPQTPVLPVILSLLAIILLSVSGYLGGMLVYDDGIGVGRHRRPFTPPRETLRISSAKLGPGEKSESSEHIFLPINSVENIKEGEPWRLDLDGAIVTLIKLDGEFFAFQEFCTHRYGPLSEGRFHNGKVQCPWHNSCFDIRTGEVSSGPAKIELRTFPVKVENGKVRVGIPRNDAVGKAL